MYKLLFIVIWVTSFIYAATGQPNVERNTFYDNIYTQYRHRLKQKFIVIDSCVEFPGVNIPAVEIDRNKDIIDWGDANSNMSHYLGILATEFALNKDHHRCNDTTTKELLYALLALERLDLYSEAYSRNSNQGSDSNTFLLVKPFSDINGFHLRDDVSSDFWAKFGTHFNAKHVKSVFLNNQQALSQDNLIHNLEGLALIAKLTEQVNVKNIPVFFYTPIISTYLQKRRIWVNDTIDFPRWAKDLSLRYFSLIQHSETWRLPKKNIGIKTHWYLTDPVQKELVPEGSGKDLDLALFYGDGIVRAIENITQTPIDRYPGIMKKEDCIFKILFRYRITIFPKNRVLFELPFDDYKLRSLATLGNILGSETYHRLVLYRNVSPVFSYEHFPLIWLILHAENSAFKLTEEEIENERRYYLKLFGDIPKEGPTSNNSTHWRSTSRLVWPENLNRHTNSNSEFSGMDFMLLYNLYQLTLAEKSR